MKSSKSLLVRMSVFIGVFLIMVTFMIVSLFMTNRNDTISRNELISKRNFYFKGSIIKIDRITKYNNIVLINLDSIYLKNQQIDQESPFFHGYYSENQNRLIFFCKFSNDTKNENLPKYIWVDAKKNRIDFDQAIKPYNEIWISKIYSEYMDEFVEQDSMNGWRKF